MNVFSGPPGKGNFRAPIDPRGITLPETKSHLLECDATDLRTTGDAIATAGNDITSSWAGLSGCYSAPEDETLFAALNPVATDGDDVDTALGSAATALETFAETAREIRMRLVVLRGKAEAFNESIRGDEDWDQGGILGGESDKVGELDDLRSDIARAQEDFTAAEIECANAITALVPGGTHFKSADPDGSTTAGENEFVYGLTEIPDDMATPWGSPAATDHHWWVDASHAGWDWAKGGVVDLGGMTGTYHEGQWGVPIILFGPMMPLVRSQGQANFQNYWGDTLTGAATLTGFYQGEGPERFTADDNPLTRSYAWEWDGWHIPESRHAWEDNVRSAAVEAAHGSVSWREWDQRPGYVLTQGTITGVSVAAGGFGLVKGGLGGLRALGRGDFNFDALTPDTLRDLLAGATLRPDGSTGGIPRPNANGADDHPGFDQLDEARETLDDLTEQTQRSSPAPPSPPDRGANEPSTPAPTDRGDAEPNTPTSPERAETSVPQQDRDGAEENTTPVQDTATQDPTTQQAATQAALERMLRDDASLAQTLDPDLLELLRGNGPDRPWVASPFRDTDDDSVLAGVGGRGDDTLTESAGTPAPTPDRPLDLTDVGDLGPHARAPGPDLRDNTPTITNSAGDGGPPHGGPAHDPGPDSGTASTDASPGTDTGSGSSGSGSGSGSGTDGTPFDRTGSGGIEFNGDTLPDQDATELLSIAERDRESGFWTQSDRTSNLDPNDPSLRRDDIAERLDQAGLNQQQQNALIENLMNNKSNEGRQVAEIIHTGALQDSIRFNELLTEMISRSQDSFRGHAAEIRFAYDLTQQGYPSNRIDFPPKNTLTGDDVDVAIRGNSGEVEYSYQIKSVETVNGVRKKFGEVIRQLSGETAGTTNKAGIFEVQQEMSSLNERTRQAIYDAAMDSGVSFRLYFTDGTMTIPPGAVIYPE